MKQSRIILLGSALSLAVLGVACGGDDGDGGAATQKGASQPTATTAAAGAGGTTVTVSAKEFAFEAKDIKVSAGQATAIVLKNTGAVEHDITIDDPAFKVKAAPTKTDQATLTIPTAGTYTYYCSVPGHRQAGMEGSVTVS